MRGGFQTVPILPKHLAELATQGVDVSLEHRGNTSKSSPKMSDCV